MILVFPPHTNQDCDSVEDGWTNTEKEQGTDQRLFCVVLRVIYECIVVVGLIKMPQDISGNGPQHWDQRGPARF